MHAPRLLFPLFLLALAPGCGDEPAGTQASAAVAGAPAPSTPAAAESTAVPPEAAAALQRAREAYARRDPAAAVSELEQAVALAPRWAEARRSLGKLLLSTSTVWFATKTLDRARRERATTQLLAAQAQEHTNAESTFSAARALVLEKREAEGETMLLAALRLDPAHGLACKELGLLHAAQGDVERAKQQLARAAELRPEDDEVLFQLGLQLEAEGDLQRALDAHRRALAINPAHQGPRARLVSLHQRLGQKADADREARELERWSEFAARLHAANKSYETSASTAAALALARLFQEGGMLGAAREWLELALQHDPGSAEAAQLLRELGAPANEAPLSADSPVEGQR